MYSTGNCIQYCIITYDGKNLKKKKYVYVLVHHFAVCMSIYKNLTIIQLKIILEENKPLSSY